ncbi:MAG: FAD-dependent oxidoreductase [Trueperaceae bacterium]|nr:MAG: FAD-dependent oxidoreductase [Trueperaceae bacterium]
MSIVPDTGHWDRDVEIVVIGGGGCGLTAALAAAQGGARVEVLEKLPHTTGNTGRSGGMIPAAGTKLQRAAGIEEAPESFATDIFRKNGYASDEQTTLHLCRISAGLVDWLVGEIGIDLVFVDDFKYPGHSQFRMHAPPNRTGASLINGLRRAVDAVPAITLSASTTASGLIVGEQGLQGVIVRRSDREERWRSRKVILANNGFAGSPDMVRKYCPAMASALYFGGEGNTGEGILWGQELGAELEFMDAYQAHASVATEQPILITYSLIMEGGIQVNSEAERFGNETSGYSEHALAVLDQPGAVAYDIFDENLHQLGLKFDGYRQAFDMGIIHRSDTAAGLAKTLGLDAGTLEQTLERYGEVAVGNIEDGFGRRDCRLLQPPLYGVKVTGALFHTQGGLKVDHNARVLRPDGSAIDHLYAGGGAAAGISGHGPGGYLSGNGLLTALGYGMLAGRHAAQTISEEM